MTQRRTLNTALVLTPEKREFIQKGGDQPEPKGPRPDRYADEARKAPVRETLVPLTTRIGQQTAESLRRAYLQQKLAGRLPDTQQEIVEAALRQWLGDHGFLG